MTVLAKGIISMTFGCSFLSTKAAVLLVLARISATFAK